MFLQFLSLLLGVHICLADVTTIIRPCELSDYKCIGDNLAANSKCKVKQNGFLPSKYFHGTLHFDTPYFNASYIDNNLTVRNNDKCTVSEFFFNTRTDRVVLGLECKFLEFESDRTLIQHRTFQEDGYFNFHIRGLYPLIRITINLPSVTHMDLCSATIYTEVCELPRLLIDPKNKPTAKQLSRDLRALFIYERENFHARGPGIAYKFIDSLLCDYGCPMPK